MAKKKTSDKKPVEPAPPPRVVLTDGQIKALGDVIEGTTINVYTKVKLDHGEGVDMDDVFARLRSVAGLHRCVECNVWKSVEQFDGHEDPGTVLGPCDVCVAQIDAEIYEED